MGHAQWTQQNSHTNAYLTGVYFTNSVNGVACGTGGTIIITQTGGGLWKPVSSNTTTDLRDIYFLDAQNGWIAGDNGTILKTTNGGVSWSKLPKQININLNTVYFAHPDTGWVAGNGSKAYYTVNGGQTWQNLGVTTWYNLRDMDFGNRQNGWIAEDEGFVVFTTDGGLTWDSTSVPVANGADFFGVSAPEPNFSFIVGNDGVMVKGSNTFTLVNTPTTEHLRTIDFADANNGFAAGQNGTIISTTDGGNSWQSVTSLVNKTFYGVYAHSANNAWVVGASGTIVSNTTLPTNLIDGGIAPTVCANADTFSLGPVYPEGGTWTGPGVDANGLATPALAGHGTHILTYSHGSLTDTVLWRVLSKPAKPQIMQVPNRDTLYADVAGNTYRWWRNGLLQGNKTQRFWAANSGVYEVQVSNGYCWSDTSDAFDYTLPVSAGNDTGFCQGDAPHNLKGYPTGGIWLGNGISNMSAGTFDPATAGLGTHTIRYYRSNIFDTTYITVSAKPAKPAINVIIDASNQIDSLKCTTMADGYIWLVDSVTVLPDTTQAIKPTTTGAYSVIALNQFCPSEPSDTVLVAVITSVKLAPKSLNQLDFFPNPANKVLYLNNEQTTMATNYLIFNISGSVLQSGEITKQAKINIEALPKGIFFVRLNDNRNQPLGVLKFIKN